ncbi:MAG: penicillin-binding transpeptidase domain-containing protein [Candidatus Gottesmanbacteria bacterium]
MRWRYLLFYLSLIFSTWLLLFRLFEITIIRGSYFRTLSEGNRVKELNIRAPRGIIYDRHRQVLARNKPVYKWQAADGKWQIKTNEEAMILETQGGSEAAKLHQDLIREYPWGSILAHVIGYSGEVTEKEIEDSKNKNLIYKIGDNIGRTGVEEQYENILKGVDGKELIEVDAYGKKISELGRIEPKPGKDLNLSIDLDLQKIAVQELGTNVGSIVVSNPNTGEILSLVSSPSFNSNNLNVQDLNNPSKPLFNRTIAGLYPPGSTFKIIVAAAGLESGKINAQTLIEDTGVITIGPYTFPNWYWLQYGGKEGQVNVVKAMKRSNDIFFYKVGEMVGVNLLESWANKFGAGTILGIDIPGEASGTMPTPEWRKNILGTEWYLGDTYHLAIGQGDLEITPIQVNFWTNVIANNGKLCKPSLLKSENSILSTKNCKDIGLHKETIDIIKEGMREACSAGGTGWPLFDFKVKDKNIETACKTGTAEYGDAKNKTHAWFTVFAPARIATQSVAGGPVNDPEISVTVLVEGGGEGSNVAAPIAKKILEEWFGR